MGGAERWTVVVAGSIGLVAMIVGSLVADVPRPDTGDEELRAALLARRTRLLVGSTLSMAASALLLLPIAAVSAQAADEPEAWSSLRSASVAVWVLGLGLLAACAGLVGGAAWRDPGPAGSGAVPVRPLLDVAHMSTWSLSAPVGAIAVVITTVLGWQAGVLGPLVVGMATLKVATVGVELAGTGRRAGWNAGGWARGSSGVATVAWFAAVLVALA